jgi:hypothetical protein
VFVTILDGSSLASGLISKLQPESSLLDRAMLWNNLFQNSTGQIGNLYVNQDLKIASYNSGIDLRDVMIDGDRGNVRINNVGFIVAGSQRAIIVNLIYLSTDGIEVFQQLEEEFNSLRFAG